MPFAMKLMKDFCVYMGKKTYLCTIKKQGK